MPEYLDDPSVLTKERLKSELLAHNVELPGGNPTKDVYVQLYLKNLTAQNKKHVPAATLDAFSSDEELPPPVVANRSRSSGRKATRKTDKVRPEELDVTMLTDEGLRDELLKQGVDIGPVVASTRKLYEKKLQKLLDDGPAPPLLPQLVLTDIQVNHNGNSESELYSDKEDEVTTAPEPEPEPVAEPEPEPDPAPQVERPVRSRGKTPVSTRTRSSQHHMLMHVDDDDDEPVLQVKNRSRRLSHRMIVPEELRPVMTHPVQLESKRKVHQQSYSPARVEPCSTWSIPVQIQKEELGPDLPKPSADSSHRPVAGLNRSLLESKGWPEHQSLRPAAGPLSPLALSTRVHPVTFSPMCNISPIKSQETRWTVSDRIGSGPSGISAAVVEKITASDQNPKVENDVLKELFPSDINSPTGITATCRRPIRGAAGRPVKSSDLWSNENGLFSPKTSRTSSSSYTESHTVNRVTSLPPSYPSATFTSSFSTPPSSSRLLSAAPPAGKTKVVRRGRMSLWIKLFLLAIVAAFVFLVYQAMETNTINPFVTADTEEAGDSKA